MKPLPDEIQKKMNHFKDVLRRSGAKLTHQRMEVFREVALTAEHPDAETVWQGVRERVPSVSLDTVYRTLLLLLDLELITSLRPTRERMRFDANMSSHHHFMCRQCGTICDFYSPEFDALTIPKAVKALGNIERTRVELRGLCSRCSKSKRGK